MKWIVILDKNKKGHLDVVIREGENVSKQTCISATACDMLSFDIVSLSSEEFTFLNLLLVSASRLFFLKLILSVMAKNFVLHWIPDFIEKKFQNKLNPK